MMERHDDYGKGDGEYYIKKMEEQVAKLSDEEKKKMDDEWDLLCKELGIEQEEE